MGDSMLSSILGRFSGSGDVSTSQPLSRPSTTVSSRPQSSSSPNNETSKPQPTAPARPSAGNTSMARPASSSITSARTEVGVATKKRKIDQPNKSGQLSQAELDLKKKLLEMKQKNATSSAPAGKPTSNGASTPNKATTTKKPTYSEMLARAAAMQQEKKTVAGAITHQKKVAPVVEKKEWQKKLAEKKEGADRKSKSPGIASGGDNKTGRKMSEGAKSAINKKGSFTELSRKSKPLEKGRTEVTAIKRKRPSSPPPPPPRSAGRNGSSTVRKRPGGSRYDDEDEDDDWIVDDEDEEPDPRRKLGGYGLAPKRYVYADSDDDSDMEAAGADIFEEEQKSTLAAVREDREQEALERRLAAEKARKKGLK